MAKYLITIFWIATTALTFAQSVSTLMGSRAAGMGYASSALADEWALFNNPGGIGKLNESSAGFAYEIKPQLKGANRMAASLNVPFKWGIISTGMFRFGDDLYSEQIFSAGIGNQIGIASLGLKFNVVQYRAEGFGTYHAFSVDFGGITEITKQILVSAYITNLNQAKINADTEERLPTRLTVGLSYLPAEHIFITSEISKELDYETSWRTGIEYALYKKIYFRTGFNLNPNAGFFGLGGRKKKVRLDYSIQLHHITGTSHQASAAYWFGKQKEQ